MTKRRTTPAMIIKAELKKAFPWVKFSCKYQSFSWGDSVDIYWKGWPLTRDVDRIASQYQDWYFDWMEDLYHYTNDKPSWMTAKYVMCNRERDNEQAEQFMTDAWYTKEELLSGLDEFDDYDKRRSIASRVMYKMDDITNNHWDNYSEELYQKNKEIWWLVATYVVFDS